MMKPYRLINSSEMEKINQHCHQILQEWNDEYALLPLKADLSPPPKDYEANQSVQIIADNKTIALVEKEYLDFFKRGLFSDNHPCFNSVGLELMQVFVQKLLQREHCSIHETTAPLPNWFYRGSTCLLLTLSMDTPHPLPPTTIILNPEWVYQLLTTCKSPNHQGLDSIDEALTERTVDLNLALIPFNLPINQLITIQTGDVIASDHPITTPLRLTQNEQLIADAELGQSLFHKSIVLKRST